jgi:steroid delta-isomerase-like uncharacterized protein
MTVNDNVELVRLAHEVVWSRGDLDTADRIFAEDLVRHDPNWAEVRGLAPYKQLIQTARGAFPDWHETVEDLVATDDRVATRVTIRGTHKGQLLGYHPSGREFSVSCMIFYRIADGKIAELWSQWDALSFYESLGLSPPEQ